MKVLIIGLNMFARELAKELNEYDPSGTYIALNTYYSKKDKLRYFYHLFTADTIYSMNGTLDNSLAFRLALWLNKRVIVSWMGTDVLKAMEAKKNGTVKQEFIDKITHYSEPPWLREELAEIGVPARELIYSMINVPKETLQAKEFAMLSYIGKNREVFYGMEHLIWLAKQMPDIPVYVMGVDSYDQPVPENLKLLGWVTDVPALYSKYAVFLRLTQHDGLPNSVLEALSHGRQVIWFHDYPETIEVADRPSLLEAVKDLKSRWEEGPENLINHKGVEFVRNSFERTKTLDRMINVLSGK